MAALKAATPVGKGLALSPGAACGKIVFSADDADKLGRQRVRRLFLVRLETSPEDITGMKVCPGYPYRSWRYEHAHAAVVARGMGTCCVSGCGEIEMDEDNKNLHLGRQRHSTKEITFLSMVQQVISMMDSITTGRC